MADSPVSGHSQEGNSGQEILCTHGNGGQSQSWLHQHQRNIQFSDLQGHEKGKGTQPDMLSPAVRSPSCMSISRTPGGAGKNQAWGKENVFQERLGEKATHVCLKDNHTVT